MSQQWHLVNDHVGVAVRTDGLFAPTSDAVPVPLTIENKTIMTAHGKARTNRYNDARAYAGHVHAASPDTVAAFTIVINTALAYRNPDAFARTAKVSRVTRPDDAKNTIDLFRRMRSGPIPRRTLGAARRCSSRDRLRRSDTHGPPRDRTSGTSTR